MKKLLGLLCAALLAATARGEDVSGLINKLRDKDPETRRTAAKALSEAGAEAKPAVAALSEAVKRDKDMFVRRFAAQALGALGADAREAIPALATALNDEKKEVAEASANALGKIGPSAVPALMDVLKTGKRTVEKKPKGKQPASEAPNASVRRKAVESLGLIGPDAKEAVPVLMQNLKDKDIATDVATALGNIGPNAKDAVPALKDIAEDKKTRDRNLKLAAMQAVKKIGAGN